LDEAREKFTAMLTGIDAELAGLFSRYDAAQDRSTLEEMGRGLNRRRYVSNLIREVDKELNVHLSN
jgi:hypothetical protein